MSRRRDLLQAGGHCKMNHGSLRLARNFRRRGCVRVGCELDSCWRRRLAEASTVRVRGSQWPAATGIGSRLLPHFSHARVAMSGDGEFGCECRLLGQR